MSAVQAKAAGRRWPIVPEFELPPLERPGGAGSPLTLRELIARVGRGEVEVFQARQEVSQFDDGSSIEQDVARVSHRHDVTELERIARDIEGTVLARAVSWRLEDRVVVYEDKTSVFE
jgi:hypothetical protein